MRVAALVVLLPAAAVHSIRIIHGNDDGWAELYTRSFFESLVAAGHDVVLSAPADNKSGTGSTDFEPLPRRIACQYDSCPAKSGPIGRNETSPRLNWVNSFPVTAVRYGIDTTGPQFWNGRAPQLAVAGPNVGSNLHLAVPFSGTVGVAVHAAKEAGIPSIAFSGESGGTLAWNTSPVPQRSLVYAALATTLTTNLIASGVPYLPPNVWLNVNFPEVTDECNHPRKFKWVLTRINNGVFSAPDVQICGRDRLPTETDVVKGDGCYASISVGDALDKTTASADKQAVVLRKLARMLSCWSK